MAVNEHTSDFELADKLQKGDLEAFDQIFKRYGDRLFGFALNCLFQLKSIPEFQSKSIPFYLNKKGMFLLGGTPG